MSPVNVGERIRQLRLGLGLSVRALAAATGFSPSLISQIEHGHVMPSIGSLECIAMALGVSLSTFFAEPEPTSDELVRANARQKLTSTWSPVSIEASSDGEYQRRSRARGDCYRPRAALTASATHRQDSRW